MKAFVFKNLKHISLVCLLAVMVAIFVFSSQSAQQSSKLSGKIVNIVIKVVIPNYDNLSFIEKQQIKDKASYIIRKIAHFTEFAALGFFLLLYLFSGYGFFNFFKYKIFFSWFFGSIYAVSDEFHQMFVTDRYSSIKDVMIDSSGVIFGIIILVFILFHNKDKILNYYNIKI